ncbi:hypothetical protein [Streptomyces halobius]|uniref:Secreted protein n=1 Tax=Streptomyces halobius TaxID=2879846 RepID=A0ABY4M7N8_9ACTN|nr:hypothetical protein [Streptomyces halobius]UQA93762.1 hypothetical protein K9S39_19515 [Streptomyces halobius]
MSEVPGSNLISPVVSLAKGSEPLKKRRAAKWGATAAVVVAAGVSLWAWEPWVDRSPFTALVAGASPVTDPGSKTESGECTPNLAGEAVVIYDASGKSKLASGIEPSTGEVLPSSYGDVAGWCFYVTRIDGLPGGEGTYKVQVGRGNLVTVEEEHLRQPVDQQREGMRKTKLPPDDAPAPELPAEQ